VQLDVIKDFYLPTDAQ